MISTTQPRLEAVSLEALAVELRARGFAILPLGDLPQFGRFQDRERNGRDAGPVLLELRRLASVDLPAAVAYAQQLGERNLELERRARQAEQERDLLISAAVANLTDERNTDA